MSKFKPSSWSPVPARSAPAESVVTEERPSAASTTEPKAPETPAQQAPAGSFDRVSLYLALAFLFFRISFLHEFITTKVHVDLHLLMVLGGLSCLSIFLTGKWVNGARDRNALIWFGFAACLGLATVLSSWRGGSLPIFLTYLRTTLPLLLLLPAVIGSREDLQKVIGTIGWAGIGMVALGFTAKEYKGGRMIIVGASSIGDSNDYAAQLMFVLPIIAYILFAARKSKLRRLLGLVAIPAGLYQLLSTGSRGAMVSACLTMLLILFISRPKIKVALLLGIPAIALLAIPFVPTQAVDRLASLFKSGEDKTGEAAESAEARRRLLSQSIKLSLSNPLTGVGPGQFMDSEGAIAKESGRRGMWHETHNTYTQVSSECGLPALFCFVSALGFTLRRLWKARSSGDRTLAGVAQVIFISSFGFCICVFFLSHAYGFAFLISTGLAISIDRLLAAQEATTPDETANPTLAPAADSASSRQVPLHA